MTKRKEQVEEVVQIVEEIGEGQSSFVAIDETAPITTDTSPEETHSSKILTRGEGDLLLRRKRSGFPGRV